MKRLEKQLKALQNHLARLSARADKARGLLARRDLSCSLSAPGFRGAQTVQPESVGKPIDSGKVPGYSGRRSGLAHP